jgi:hypothetical protein
MNRQEIPIDLDRRSQLQPERNKWLADLSIKGERPGSQADNKSGNPEGTERGFVQQKGDESPSITKEYEVLAKKWELAQKAFELGSYDIAETVARDIYAQRQKIPRGDFMIDTRFLLARSMSRQGKDASAMFDEALDEMRAGTFKGLDFGGRPIDMYKNLKARIRFEKGVNLLSRKDKPIDATAAKEEFTLGIDSLKASKDVGDKKVLVDLYSGRAAAKLVLGDVEGAKRDNALSAEAAKAVSAEEPVKKP